MPGAAAAHASAGVCLCCHAQDAVAPDTSTLRPVSAFPAVKVTNGPRYRLKISGASYKPRLHLSFTSHDFGPCHVWQQGMSPARAALVIENRDQQPVSYDVMFDDSNVWQVASSPSVLVPGQRSEVGVSFTPIAAQEYASTLLMRVNGLYSINVTLKGAAAPQIGRAHV